ncbi:MAG: dihydropteroate synthase [Chloroflexi bacterium]|nr:dihydropteroate synthase [Chloroflexota bacterium]
MAGAPSPSPSPSPLAIGRATLAFGLRTYVMGILNVTPDSFSGDGLTDPDAVAAHAEALVAAGADLLDLGAESTRPGYAGIDEEEEWGRLGPALRAVRRAVAVPLTVDTTKRAVAERAFDEGADGLNDVLGLLGDPGLAELLARSGKPAVLMHNQRGRAFGGDVIGDIRAGLEAGIAIAERAGVPRARLVVDPGFGFGWEPEQNLEMLRRLRELKALGCALLVGTSRKSTLGRVLGRPERERLWGTAATVALAIAGGADIVRVHDVAELAQVARMADAVVRGWRPPEARP